MSAPVVQGWCPGAHRPMRSGDGLVVRVRPWLGALTPDQARGLAHLAERCGNGRIEITSRANLQLRGVQEATLSPLLDGLAALDLLDPDDGSEARRNVILPPRLEGPWDQTAMAQALCDGLRDPAFAALPGKFGFAVDAGTGRQLVGISGDIRIESAGDRLILRADGADLGCPMADEDAAVRAALDLALWFIAHGVGQDGRGRMKRLTVPLPDTARGTVAPDPALPSPRPGADSGGLYIAAAFGQLTPGALRALAGAARGALRITPYRMVYLPGVADLPEPVSGLIAAPDDPRLNVIACTGAPDCPQAGADIRALALHLAPRLNDTGPLHLSGCAKGCAHPRAAPMTLVARDGGFDLVKQGAPWDEPCRRGLTHADLDALFPET